MADRARETYRGATLIARKYGSRVRGKAWNDGNEISSLEGDSQDDVLEALRQAVDAAFTVDSGDNEVAYPDEAAYVAALNANAKRITEKYRHMLKAHYDAPGRSLNVRELAAAAGYPSWSSANLHYGKLGRLLGESLLFQPRPRAKGDPNWTLMLADCNDDECADDQRQWCMREAVAGALKEAGIV